MQTLGDKIDNCEQLARINPWYFLCEEGLESPQKTPDESLMKRSKRSFADFTNDATLGKCNPSVGPLQETHECSQAPGGSARKSGRWVVQRTQN